MQSSASLAAFARATAFIKMPTLESSPWVCVGEPRSGKQMIQILARYPKFLGESGMAPIEVSKVKNAWCKLYAPSMKQCVSKSLVLSGPRGNRLASLIFREALVSFGARSLTFKGYSVLFKFSPFLFFKLSRDYP
jgi:hypothetical protein